MDLSKTMASSLSAVIALLAALASAEAQAYDAVIVGAGWAGIRALRALTKAGVDNVLLLEANDRVGGRCWSMNADGTSNDPKIIGGDVIPYDLGADLNYNSGINSQQDSLYGAGLMPDEMWENDPHVDWPHWAGWTTFYQEQDIDGELVTERITDGLGQGFDGDGMLNYVWWTFVEWRAENLDMLEGKSFGEAIDMYIEEDRWTDDEALDFLDLIHDASHLQFGTGGYGLDISEAMEDSDFHEAANYVGIPGAGWGNIAAAYAEQFGDKIRLNSRVNEIDQEENEHYAIVKYTDEDGNDAAVGASTVLVTASLGVLKADNINFAPQLSAARRRAIDNTGFGIFNKCVMSWDDPSAIKWPRGDTWFLLATEDEETSGKWTTFSNPTKYKGVPALTGWIGGEDAVAMEEQSDDDILKDVMRSLDKMFPGITRPDNVYISRWGEEPDVLGVYSFPATGQDHYGDMDAMCRRDGRVYFAGEHCSQNGWSTVFGAWDSGEEKAEEMAGRIPGLKRAAEAAGATLDLDDYATGEAAGTVEELGTETDASKDDGSPEGVDAASPEADADAKDVEIPEADAKDDVSPATEATDVESQADEDSKDDTVEIPEADAKDNVSPAAEATEVESQADEDSKDDTEASPQDDTGPEEGVEDEAGEVKDEAGEAEVTPDASASGVAPAGSPAEVLRTQAWGFVIGPIVVGLMAALN